MVSEHESDYICGFSVYTGKMASELVAENVTLDTHCSIMTKTVMGLLQRTRLLDNHRTVFFDNYFRYFTTPPLNLNLQSNMIKNICINTKLCNKFPCSSCELLEEMLFHDTYGAGKGIFIKKTKSFV